MNPPVVTPAPDPTENALEIQGVSFAYGGHQVLQSIGLGIPRGAFVGLLGPNGAGKTTLLQIASGALTPAQGRVLISGRPLLSWDRRELARILAVVPQRFEPAFPFRVGEIVLLGRVPFRGELSFDSPHDLAVAERAMRATGVWELADRRFEQLSGGEQKRVVIAKALAQEPRLLLLDEPAAHLDIRHQLELYELIERIRRERGLTVLSAMHDLNLAAAYCQSVALLMAGQLHAFGPIEEVMTYRQLREVFGCEIYVGINELTGHRLFSPMQANPGTAEAQEAQ